MQSWESDLIPVSLFKLEIFCDSIIFILFQEQLSLSKVTSSSNPKERLWMPSGCSVSVKSIQSKPKDRAC